MIGGVAAGRKASVNQPDSEPHLIAEPGSAAMISRARVFLFAGLLFALVLCLAAAARAQIVGLGASNVAGRGVSSSEAFPAQLERMLAARGYNVQIANAGVSGDTNVGMLGRLDQVVPDGTRIVLLGAIGGTFNARRLGQGD
jgi:acyl-CoA thioesterase-1